MPDDRATSFSDVLTANAAYAEGFALGGLAPRAARGLAIVTCMDSRIEPLAMLGLAPGDAKILRNAGARVTDDVLRSLVLASYLLGVDRAMVIAHTRCRMAEGGPDTDAFESLVTDDQEATVRDDVRRARSSPHLKRVTFGGFIYDVDTGLLKQLC
jgi:carbonic anhydrase